MIIVGEKINTSRRNIAEAVEKRDADYITKVAREQAEAGAQYIDVNTGTFLEKEVEYLYWLVETVQSEVNLPLSLDSPNPKALSEAIRHHRGEPMINSISLEYDRFQSLFPVVAGVFGGFDSHAPGVSTLPTRQRNYRSTNYLTLNTLCNAELIEKFVKSRRDGLSPRSIDNYRLYLRLSKEVIGLNVTGGYTRLSPA